MEKRKYRWTTSNVLDGYRECLFEKLGNESNRDAYYIDYDGLDCFLHYKLKLSKPLKRDEKDMMISDIRKLIVKTLYNILHHNKSITIIDIYGKNIDINFHFSTSFIPPTPEAIVELMEKVQQVLTDNGF